MASPPKLSNVEKTALVISLALAGVFLEIAMFWLGIGRARRFANAGRRFERRLSARRATILVLGDSTGVGVGATRPEESLAGLFAADYPDADIINVAVSGTRVADAITQARRCFEAGLSFDLALLHVGGIDVIADTPLPRLADNCDILMRELGQLAVRTLGWGPRTSGSRRCFRGPMPGSWRLAPAPSRRSSRPLPSATTSSSSTSRRSRT